MKGPDAGRAYGAGLRWTREFPNPFAGGYLGEIKNAACLAPGVLVDGVWWAKFPPCYFAGRWQGHAIVHLWQTEDGRWWGEFCQPRT